MATKARATPDEQAMAVARVLAGESRRKVAEENGVSDSTVRRWMAAAERRGTAQEKELAEQAEQIAADIEQRLIKARDVLLERLVEVVPSARGVQSIAVAFGIIQDKLAMAQGLPTSRMHVRNEDQLDREIEELLEELDGRSNGNRPARR